MRPRVFPAEDIQQRTLWLNAIKASMRPRVFPAEDPVAGNRPAGGRRRFNEAAGIPPRKTPSRCSSTLTSSGFNEAAGIPRGRLQVEGSDLVPAIMLQ